MSVKRAAAMASRGRVFYRLRQRLEQYGPDGVHPETTPGAARASAGGAGADGAPRDRLRVGVADVRAAVVQRPARPRGRDDRAGDDLAPAAAAAPGHPSARAWRCWSSTARTTGLLTERTAKPIRHVAAARPGDLLCLDTFYVGKLKGVGKVWQITGCDAASSFGWARLIVGEVTAAAVLAFLREVVRPTYRQAGWTLRRVLTDNGKEFKGAFAAGCARLHLRVTKTKPRHAWTNGFVERLQKTILHEHWRIAFRRQYFTSRRSLQGTLDRFLQFYNHERTHRGYRLNGRTPATVFKGAVAA